MKSNCIIKEINTFICLKILYCYLQICTSILKVTLLHNNIFIYNDNYYDSLIFQRRSSNENTHWNLQEWSGFKGTSRGPEALHQAT